jgi:DNA-binding TFAR19-related protein (PDSD5 family)
MKATIALTNTQLADQVLKSLITLIQGNSQLQQHITNQGIWFEHLNTVTISTLKPHLHP